MDAPLPHLSTPLLAPRIGRIAPLGPEAVPSAIDKRPVESRLAVTRLGLAGDQQADREHHGGIDKAIHHYPAEHYAAWRAELPGEAARFEVGGFGENLSTRGLTEAMVCLGDRFRLGSAVVEVSQARQPCAKLNLRFHVPDMKARVFASGRSGWYYRVIEAGEVGVGDSLTLIARPHPDWPLTRVWQVLFDGERDPEALARLIALPELSASWRERAGKRLATGDAA